MQVSVPKSTRTTCPCSSAAPRGSEFTHPVAPAEPEPHEEHLWDTGFHWGEWLEPGGEPSDFPAFIAADKSDVATAFYAWTTRHA